MTKALYFAYGSDMSLRQMQQRLLEAEIILDETARSSATLKDWELRFDKSVPQHPQVGLAAIHPMVGSVVEGVLYEIPAKAMAALDLAEGVADGHYQRLSLEVVSAKHGAITAQVYVPNDLHIHPGLKPTRNHLYRLLAAEKFLSPEYFLKLKRTESLKVPVDDDGMPHANPPEPQEKPRFTPPRKK